MRQHLIGTMQLMVQVYEDIDRPRDTLDLYRDPVGHIATIVGHPDALDVMMWMTEMALVAPSWPEE